VYESRFCYQTTKLDEMRLIFPNLAFIKPIWTKLWPEVYKFLLIRKNTKLRHKWSKDMSFDSSRWAKSICGTHYFWKWIWTEIFEKSL